MTRLTAFLKSYVCFIWLGLTVAWVTYSLAEWCVICLPVALAVFWRER